MQRVCYESEKAGVQGTEVHCPFSTADKDNLLFAAVELPKGCRGLQFLFLRSQPKSEKPLWVAKGKRENLETHLF